MIVKCTLSVVLKNIGIYAGKISESPPLPGYITRRGPFIHHEADGDRINTVYEFDKSRLGDAWEIVFNQLHVFRDIPGFIFLAHRSMVFSEVDNKQLVAW